MHIDIDGAAPLLIFGGPYSNLQATHAMRARAVALGMTPDRVICTGDVVAYCADPEETVGLIRDWGCHVIQGNCETSLANRAADCGCGFDEGTACDLLSKGWYPYADRRISADSRNWMNALPERLDFVLGERCASVIHGGVTDQSRFLFASSRQAEKRDELAACNADIVIAGHCGIPFIERIGNKIWFNPGVIGMPANDGTRDGWFGMIEPSDGTLGFRIFRLSYDAELAAGRLRDAGSAPAYADALLTGHWPSLDVLPEAERSATGRMLASACLVV